MKEKKEIHAEYLRKHLTLDMVLKMTEGQVIDDYLNGDDCNYKIRAREALAHHEAHLKSICAQINALAWVLGYEERLHVSTKLPGDHGWHIGRTEDRNAILVG